jgi:lysophospholipase L1-like esterase
MRLPRITSLAMAAVAAAGLATAGPASADTAHYYVAFGDSLSVGYQPGQGNTTQGYVDDLYTTLKAKDPSLQLVKLGCAGETTATLMNGGVCTYPEGSQLKAGEAFLKAHQGQVKYVTLNIGANDVQRCLKSGSIDTGCLLSGIGAITVNLPQITARLRLAAGAGPRFAAMTYYDPFLAAWTTGTNGKILAGATVLLTNIINGLESGVYRVSGFSVADVSATFSTNDFTDQETLPGVGQVPRDVARICQWTWECTSYQDIHANATGYQQIANTFAGVLG